MINWVSKRHGEWRRTRDQSFSRRRNPSAIDESFDWIPASVTEYDKDVECAYDGLKQKPTDELAFTYFDFNDCRFDT